MAKDGTRYSRKYIENFLNSIFKPLLKGLEYEVCGSYRRQEDTIGDIDILLIDNDKKKELYKKVKELPNFVLDMEGETKISFEIDKIHVDMKFVPKKSWGAGLLHHTGPWGFNIKLRSIAKKRGMLLNEYGLYERETKKLIASETEGEILKELVSKDKANKFINPKNRKTPSWLKKEKA